MNKDITKKKSEDKQAETKSKQAASPKVMESFP